MRSEWKEVRLEDITSKLGDGLHGTPKYDDKGEYYFINGNNIGNGKITITENTKRVNYNEYLKLKKDLNDRTVFVSINGTLGNVGLYNGEKVCLGKSACYFNVKDNTDKHFVKYIMSSRIFQHYINTYATGTTIKNMGLKAMRNFSFYLPPLPTQKKIAHILSTLDDKIELNRKMNETLEAMAQALFKSWFVDFDPVHAKAECKSDAELEKAAAELGISKAVLELFPSTFVESEMGMIPEGWEVKFLKDITKITMGQSPKGESYNFDNEGLGLLNGAADFKSGILVPQKYTTDSKREAEQGDLVFCIRATIGLLTYTDKKYSLGRGVSAIRAEDIYKELVYLRLYNQIERMKSMATGSVIIGLKKDDIENLEVIVANDSVMNTFHILLKPMFEKMEANTFQIRTLQQTRDTLLPKLLSGELDVSNMEVT